MSAAAKSASRAIIIDAGLARTWLERAINGPTLVRRPKFANQRRAAGGVRMRCARKSWHVADRYAPGMSCGMAFALFCMHIVEVPSATTSVAAIAPIAVDEMLAPSLHGSVRVSWPIARPAYLIQAGFIASPCRREMTPARGAIVCWLWRPHRLMLPSK